MAGNQINFSAADIIRIQSKVGAAGSVGQYSAAYREVLAINTERQNAGLPVLDSKTRYWFEKAVEVNQNNSSSSSNFFIRSVTAGGFSLFGVGV